MVTLHIIGACSMLKEILNSHQSTKVKMYTRMCLKTPVPLRKKSFYLQQVDAKIWRIDIKRRLRRKKKEKKKSDGWMGWRRKSGQLFEGRKSFHHSRKKRTFFFTDSSYLTLSPSRLKKEESDENKVGHNKFLNCYDFYMAKRCISAKSVLF